MNRIEAVFSVILGSLLTCMVLVTLTTMVAIERSRERTSCLKMAESSEQCDLPSRWENILKDILM